MIVVIFSVLWGCHGVIYSFSFESSVSSLYSLQKINVSTLFKLFLF